jgi:hypothetical protein
VVGGDRQVLAAEAALGEQEVAGGRLERRGGVEALVDAPARSLQPGYAVSAAATALARDPPRVAAALGDVDAESEQVLPGLGEDLRQPDRRVG